MPSADYGGENINFFETGYIIIGKKRFDVEEISINASRDMTPYHVAAQRDPIDQRPGKNKIEFSFKRAFSDAILANMYDTCCVFSLLLINNDDPTNQQQVVLLEGCRLSQDNIGPVNGSDVVSEDLQGVARRRIWKMCHIRDALAQTCELGCPSTTESTWTGSSATQAAANDVASHFSASSDYETERSYRNEIVSSYDDDLPA